MEPAVLDGVGRGLGLVQVALHDGRTLGNDLANLAPWQLLAL